MKLLMYLAVFTGISGTSSMIFGMVSHGETKAKSQTSAAATAAAAGRHLNTSFDFEDMLVQGKYQYPDEAVATVENEKLLKDLLEVRKDFKDRMKQEASRE